MRWIISNWIRISRKDCFCPVLNCHWLARVFHKNVLCASSPGSARDPITSISPLTLLACFTTIPTIHPKHALFQATFFKKDFLQWKRLNCCKSEIKAPWYRFGSPSIWLHGYLAERDGQEGILDVHLVPSGHCSAILRDSSCIFQIIQIF